MSRTIMILPIALALSLLHVVSSGIASTWSACHCRWDPWAPWSSCTKRCGGGTQERDRSVWSRDVPGCDKFQNCASNDLGLERRLCNEYCSNGGTFQTYASTYGRCNCRKGTRGPCCKQIVTCGPPSTISHGSFHGREFTYGKTVQFVCSEGYNMTAPSSAVRRCSEYGTWSGHSPVCLYAVSCTSSPCKNGATCTDTLGGYVCTCGNGWTGTNCELDIQPPVYDVCPDDIVVHTSNLTHTASWAEPVFKDPFGGEVVVTQNYVNSTFEFPWGNHTVQYSAVKETNGLATECTFRISIQPHPCDAMNVPENGIRVCNGWQTAYTNICKLLCKTGFAYPSGFSGRELYTCGASGHWLPNVRMTKCVAKELQMAGVSPVVYKCDDKADTDRIATHYLDQLKHSNFNGFCEASSGQCAEENVDVTC